MDRTGGGLRCRIGFGKARCFGPANGRIGLVFRAVISC